MPAVTRRGLIIGLPLLIGLRAQRATAEDASLIAALERRHGGRLGVFAVDTATGRTLAHREDERFLMCSTFKGLLAAQVFARVDAGQESLSRLVAYAESDLIFTSPVTKANVDKRAMSVGDLARAILEYSDNTAAVLLMRDAGGPPGLTKFLRDLGDTVTRSDRYEPGSNQYSGMLDTTSPRAIIGSARKVLLGDALKLESRARLEAGMAACKPGLKRIRAGLPADWVAGDRPGTSLEQQTNDYAIVRPPKRAPLLVAAYYDAPHLSTNARDVVLQEVGSAFVTWASG
jgi:beta-lactamase class A